MTCLRTENNIKTLWFISGAPEAYADPSSHVSPIMSMISFNWDFYTNAVTGLETGRSDEISMPQ